MAAADKAQTADEQADEAQTALDLANDEVVRKENDLKAAQQIGTEADQAAAQQTLDKARLERQEAERKNKEAQERQKEANDELDKKEADLNKEGADVANQTEDSLDANDAFKSPACEKAFGTPGLSDRLRNERLGADWTDWRSRLLRNSNWSPDQQTPYDALTLPACGLDDTTNQPGAAKCDSVVMCAEGKYPDGNCGCSAPMSGVSRLVQGLTAQACSTVRCPGATAVKPTARGFVCDCSMGETDDGQRGRPGRPTAVIVDTMFGTRQSMSARPHATSAPVVRALFDGRPQTVESRTPTRP
jgi:hypothetical protein